MFYEIIDDRMLRSFHKIAMANLISLVFTVWDHFFTVLYALHSELLLVKSRIAIFEDKT